MRKLFQYFPKDSAAYVILHAMYRRSRGRRPVATFSGGRDPRKALQQAEKELSTGVTFIRLANPCTANLVVEAMKRLGVRGLTEKELKALSVWRSTRPRDDKTRFLFSTD